MADQNRIITIFGGSGFVGRYIARRMAKQGWRVRIAVRRPHEALFVRTYGVVGQVEPIQANIRDEASTRSAIAGSEVVVNCVGILAEDSRQRFDDVQADGAARIARISAEEGVARLVHLSAIGANSESESAYAKSKGDGEAAIPDAFPSAVILRPSIIFGDEDQFFNRFAGMARFTPAIPVVGAASKFQPVYVDDVAAAAELACLGEAEAGIYELGGPEIASFRSLIEKMLHSIRRRRLILSLPFLIGHIQGWVFDMLQSVTFGLFQNTLITRDQVKLLRNDNLVGEGARGFEAFGIKPRAMDAILDSYLYTYRPYGQYTDLTRSAGNLKS
jgi:NADH dehydrogenase